MWRQESELICVYFPKLNMKYFQFLELDFPPVPGCDRLPFPGEELLPQVQPQAGSQHQQPDAQHLKIVFKISLFHTYYNNWER